MSDTFSLTPEELVAQLNELLDHLPPDFPARFPRQIPDYVQSGAPLVLLPEVFWFVLTEGADGQLFKVEALWSPRPFQNEEGVYVGLLVGALTTLFGVPPTDHKLADLLSEQTISTRPAILLLEGFTIFHRRLPPRGHAWEFTPNAV